MARQPTKLMPSIWGGVLIGVISGIPGLNFINCMCCAGVMAGGILAVYLYRKDVEGTMAISMADGVALGLLAGVFGAIVGTILDGIFSTATFDILYRISEYTDNPDLLDALDRFGPRALSGGFVALGFIFELVIDCIFGLLGGMLGVAFFGKAKEDVSESSAT